MDDEPVENVTLTMTRAEAIEVRRAVIAAMLRIEETSAANGWNDAKRLTIRRLHDVKQHISERLA